jgi:uncharacterized protein YfdQ (DUF2303 family)
MSGEIEALVAALTAQNMTDTRPLTPGEVSQRAIPPGWSIQSIDTESLLDNPRRVKGEIKVRSAAGFVAAVKQRWPSEESPFFPALYADDAQQTLVAILNDDSQDIAGWRDHRVALAVSKSEEWIHWTGGQGMTSQETFAETIEKGALEITDPSPAQMLRIAETFEATIGVTFKKGAAVRDGAQQYVYEESIDATAGGGTIAIPEGFTIAVSPYIGSPRYIVRAALRTRLVSGKFTIGYTLERPHEVERSAFRDIVKDVGEQLSMAPVEGVAPEKRV